MEPEPFWPKVIFVVRDPERKDLNTLKAHYWFNVSSSIMWQWWLGKWVMFEKSNQFIK